MKQKIWLTMFALWLLLAAFSEQTFALGKSPSAAQDQTPTTTPDTAVSMAQRINAYRSAQGLPAYYPDQSLTQASQLVVDTMAATEFISHYDDTGANPQQRAEKAGYAPHVTEIIFGGFGGAEAAWEWWAENDLHHGLITSEDYVEFGVATAVNEQSGRQYWAIMFGFGDGQYDTGGLIGDNGATPHAITKLPPATSTSEVTAVSPTSTAAQPDPTATAAQAALVTGANPSNPESPDNQLDNNAAPTHFTPPNDLGESRWLIIAAIATIILGAAVFYFPRLGLSQKFKERT